MISVVTAFKILWRIRISVCIARYLCHPWTNISETSPINWNNNCIVYFCRYFCHYNCWRPLLEVLFARGHVRPWWPSSWQRTKENLFVPKRTKQDMASRAHKNCVRQHCLLVVVFCEDKVWLLKRLRLRKSSPFSRMAKKVSIEYCCLQGTFSTLSNVLCVLKVNFTTSGKMIQSFRAARGKEVKKRNTYIM